MAEELDIIRANLLPAATNVSDNDMLLVVQSGRLKRVPPSLMKGKPGDQGLSVYLGVTSTYIQWKMGISGTWQNLVSIASITGPRGEKPVFRKVGGTLQMKYEEEPDSAYKSIFDREELKMKFSDLTPAEVDKLKLKFADLSAADIALLQKPATDAATEVRKDMAQISEEANTLKTDLTEFGNTAKQAESGRVTEEGERVKAEASRANVETIRVSEEGKRVTAETSRATAETGRVTVESTRVSNEDDRKTAETDRAEAETNRATEERERVSAETIRLSAETNRNTEEGKRATAESGRVVEEGKRVTAEGLRKEEETARGDAEELREQGESGRITEEGKRAGAETIRDNAEQSRIREEGLRSGSEQNRKDVEAARVIIEQGRVVEEGKRSAGEVLRNQSEEVRNTEEGKRAGAETIRAASEVDRVDEEGERKEAESGRITAEGLRVGAESDRVVEEGKRATAETGRYEAEAARKESELLRIQTSKTAVDNANAATKSANTSATAAQEVADHPTYVGDNFYVYKWNKETKAYDKTDIFVKGEAFSIKKVYPSVADMEADLSNTEVSEGDFVLINTIDVENPDNAKVYILTTSGFEFVVDMSGAIGFTGKTPQIGIGTVSGGEAAAVTLSEDGTDPDGNPKYKLNLVLPEGEKGDTPLLSAGTVTTGDPGTEAGAELVSDGVTDSGVPKYKLNLTIPQGPQGTGNVSVSVSGLSGGKTYLFKPSADGSAEGEFVEYVVSTQIQPDWNATDAVLPSFIKNKPSTFAPSAHTHKKSEITDFPTSLPASDVSAWAKASAKPTYSATEVGASPSNHNHEGVYQPKGNYSSSSHTHDGTYEPVFAKGTAFNKSFGSTAGTVCQGNDGRLTDARPASDVSGWAKAPTKPAYTAAEVGAALAGHNHSGVYCPNGDARLSNARVASDVYTWAKQASKPGYTAAEVGASPSSHNHTGVYCPNNDARLSNARPASGGNADTVDGYHYNQFIYVDPRGSGQTLPANTDMSHCGFGYSSDGWPTSGSFISFGGLNVAGQYVTQIQAEYGGGGNIFFRTRNDDAKVWNPWKRMALTGEAQPASDVYGWAKAAAKPAYSYSEVGAVSSSDSRLSNARPASDVYAWAKTAAKPSYSYSEVGAAASSHGHGDATTGAAGFMSAADKQKVNRLHNYITSSTVASLNVDAEIIYVTLGSNASLSASAVGAGYNGRTITAFVYCSAAVTIAIPTSGSYMSMCGSSITVAAGKWVEFNLTCVGGVWHIAKLEQE